jgi:hypothetical protein
VDSGEALSRNPQDGHADAPVQERDQRLDADSTVEFDTPKPK